MSEDEIQQAIRDAEQYAAQDAFRRDLMVTSIRHSTFWRR